MAKNRTKKGNGRGSITKTKKNKPYWVRVTDPVTKKRVSLGLYKTKKEAQQKLDEYLFKKISVLIQNFLISISFSTKIFLPV